MRTLNVSTSGLILKRNRQKSNITFRKNTQTEWSYRVLWNALLLMKPSDVLQNGSF